MSKKFYIFFCVILMVSAEKLVAADVNEDVGEAGFYRSLKTVNLVLPWVDYGITLAALDKDGYYEVHPVGKFYIEKPYITVPVILVTSICFNLVTDFLHKNDCKWGAIILQVARTAMYAYIIGHNLDVLRK